MKTNCIVMKENQRCMFSVIVFSLHRIGSRTVWELMTAICKIRCGMFSQKQPEM